jgi:carboxymethylenebutenolidase
VPGLAAAAVYYGGFLEGREDDPPGTKKPIEDTSKIAVPLIGFFGNDDNNPSPALVGRLDEELNKHGIGHSFHSYAGAGHGFFCDDRDGYRPEAAADAWAKTLEFFAQHLAGAGS